MSNSSVQINPVNPKIMSAIHQAVQSAQLTSEAAENLERWMTQPQYRVYWDRLNELVQTQKFDELNRCFWERLAFGTGGRRGPMAELGSATINERTIAESAHGLAVYVKQNRSNQSEMPKAVVACDTRHHSKEFAQITASVLAGHSFQVFLFAEPRATPELSFAVRHLKCDAGVMISASHNPPSDNGFKAYWGNGGQVLPPHDAGIIECVDSATDIPMVPFNEGLADGRIQSLGDDIDMAYVNEVCRLSLSDHRDIRILYTPLHGVGETSVFRVLQQAGFENVTIFEPQRSQDGSFPNVPDHLPNPERAAVFGPAIVEAERMSADLILASDPDADRMAVAVRDHLGNYHCLTGNQLASLLADYVLSQVERAGKLTSQHYLVETLVTSQLIQAIGRHYGVDVISDLLVGFKYIAAAVDSRGADTFLFAAEESIGFMAGNYCRDKDASIGALYAAELGALLKGDGKTLIDRLHELYSLHGFHGDESRSITCPGSSGNARIGRMMNELRTNSPSVTGPCVFHHLRDYEVGESRMLPSSTEVRPIERPTGNLLIFDGRVEQLDVSIAVRPSGTEPKIKLYGFIKSPPAPFSKMEEASVSRKLTDVLDAFETKMKEIP